MKNLSKRAKLILTLISLVLILSLGVVIALSMQTYEDPIDQQVEIMPLGNYDYSKRPFIASYEPTIYKGNIYWMDPNRWLKQIPISELSCDLRTHGEDDMYFPDTYSICPDDSHPHGLQEEPEGECLDYKIGSFLVDAYESAGGSPIIYRTRFLNTGISPNEGVTQIIRYDTGNMKGETLAAVSDEITGVMSYDQWVFFMTRTSDGVYSINIVSKKGGDVTSLEVGKHGWTLMYADDNYVYYQDTAGNIYRATLDLQNPEFIFYAESISAMNSEYIGTFIYKGYLYYEADYVTAPFYIAPEYPECPINFAKHSIRRVPLDNLYGESELVAENILDHHVFVGDNNVLYYQPCILADKVKEPGKEYYWNWTGGQLLGVNLDTLEPAEIVNDIGLHIDGKTSYASGSALFVTALPTDGRYNADRHSGWGILKLFLDPSTGALYPFSVNMIMG